MTPKSTRISKLLYIVYNNGARYLCLKKRLGSDDLPPETRGEDEAEAPASGLTPPSSTVADDVLSQSDATPAQDIAGHDDLIAGHGEVSAGASNDSAGDDGLQGEQIDPEDAIEAASDGQPDVNDTVRAALHHEDEDEPEDEAEATEPLKAGDIYEGVEVLNDQKRPIDAPVSDGDGVWQSFHSNRLKVGHIVLCGWLLRCKGFLKFRRAWSGTVLCPAC